MIKITKFKEYIINSEETIRKSVIKLGKLKKNFCIVVDNNNRYIGTLTDGDIRRGLLLNFTLKDKVKDVCNRNSKFVSKISTFINTLLWSANISKLYLIPIVIGKLIINRGSCYTTHKITHDNY